MAASWFDQNTPPNDVTAGPDPNTGLASLSGSPVAKTTGPMLPPAATSGQFSFDPSKNPTDPAYVRQFVDYLAGLPNADPQLKNDPNYYVQQIIANGGGVTQDNANYWQTHVTNPANYGGGGGGANGSNSQLAALQGTPGYQFTQQQAMDAIQRSAAAKGTLLTGGTLKALQGNAAGLASTTYQQAVQNAQNLYTTGLNAVNDSTQ